MSFTNPRLSINGAAKRSDQPQIDDRKKLAADALNKRYAELNKLWENAENELKKLPIPVDVKLCYASVDADPERPDEHQIRSYLAFAQSKGGWRICFDTAHDAHPHLDFEWKPITECRVDIRLEAVPHLAKLRELVLEAAEGCVPTLDKAIADLRNTLQSW